MECGTPNWARFIFGAEMTLPPKPLLVMVAEPQPALEFKVWQAVLGGVDMLILRARETNVESIREIVSTMRTAGIKIPIVVNAGGRKPRIGESDGLHFPEATMRELTSTGNGKGLLGISVHSPEAAKEAEKLSPDYLLAGTVFETRSHPGETPGGIDGLKAICKATTVPVIAIGGITPENAGDCIKAGAYGVAAMSPFKGAGREALAKAYKEAMT